MATEIKTKSIWKSKVFWFNVISGMVAFIAPESDMVREALSYFGLGPSHAAMFLMFVNFINIVLRFTTNATVTVRKTETK